MTRICTVQLKDLLDKVDKDHSTHGNHFYYLATSPDFFGPTVEQPRLKSD